MSEAMAREGAYHVTAYDAAGEVVKDVKVYGNPVFIDHQLRHSDAVESVIFEDIDADDPDLIRIEEE